MPPKQKFTKKEVIAASLNLARRSGLEGITARALGTELGSSSRPVFTVFNSMEEVQQETVSAAKDVYNGYVQRGLSQTPAFKGVGMEYIRFAKDEPELFRLLFMTARGKAENISNILPAIDENSGTILNSVYDSYGEKHGLTREQCYNLYRHIWIFTHGIATLCATGMSDFTEEDISGMLTEVFSGLLTKQIINNREKSND